MDHLFLDTDVILDLLTDRKPFSDSIAEIFDLAVRKKIMLHSSALTFSNAYYILRKVASPRKILEQFRKLLSIVRLTDMNHDVVLAALESSFTDFEDALQNFSALQQSGIGIILTRNTKDYKHSSLIVLSPEMYCQQFPVS
jgi:predicted nucleic acid-binding protein